MSTRIVLVAHPSPDLYGADLQLLQSVAGLLSAGRRVVVAIPDEGPLTERLAELGAEVRIVDFPVLRKSDLRPASLIRTAAAAAAAVPRIHRLIKQIGPEAVYVNTVTLPWWLAACRLSGVPAVCHLHEAEKDVHPAIARLMLLPLRLATKIIVISKAARDTMLVSQPALADRAVLIYNGVPEPDSEPAPVRRRGPIRLLVVGRLSPRKAPHLVLEAAALLRAEGRDVEVEVAGSIFPSYEAYDQQLHRLAESAELAGHVTFSGHRSPIWPALADADILVQPSSKEPFGNAVVEGMLAMRPVVAADALGHRESLCDGRTGVLVSDIDAPRLAVGLRRLIDDPELAGRLAVAARMDAIARFSVSRYHREVVGLLDAVGKRSPRNDQDLIKEGPSIAVGTV